MSPWLFVCGLCIQNSSTAFMFYKYGVVSLSSNSVYLQLLSIKRCARFDCIVGGVIALQILFKALLERSTCPIQKPLHPTLYTPDLCRRAKQYYLNPVVSPIHYLDVLLRKQKKHFSTYQILCLCTRWKRISYCLTFRLCLSLPSACLCYNVFYRPL